ncbi:MAG: SUMF1/EgtB/PvdO family nonheme iron enzyme [Candidatus Eremiobacterota bacterium]
MVKYCSGCGEKHNLDAKFCGNCGCSLEETTTTGSLTPGTVIDNRYEIKKLIKSGGMGAIYQAIDKRFSNKCAVKEMVINESSHDANYLAFRFQEEAKMLRTLHHPNLPRVIDYFIEKGTYYLVMDFVEGQDLDEILRKYGKPGLPEDKVVKWAIDLLDVLSYLHGNNPPIIYRDLKPANIMIQKTNNQVMLVDFGIARSIMPENINTMTSIGTPHYSSPEQFDGKVVPQSDLFSLGATIHHLLTGKVPTPCMFKPVRQLNPDVSVELEIILEKALALEVEDRYETAIEMKNALVEYLSQTRQLQNLTFSTLNKEEKRASDLSTRKEEAITKKQEEIDLARKKEKIASDLSTRKEESAITKKKEKTGGLTTELFQKIQALPDMIQTLIRREIRNVKTTQELPEDVEMPEIEINETERPEFINNEKDEARMVLIPAGDYWIGNDDNNPNAVEIEKPKHIVNLKAYYMDKYLITNRQYCKFLNRKRMEGTEEQWIYINDTECRIEKLRGRYRVETGYDDHPVVCVTWYGAKAYAEWAEKRLPSEAEWEVAARGIERREYPWGNEWSPKKCANRCYGGCGSLMPVGSFPQGISPFKVEDMAGNVWEWCEDWLNAYSGSTYTNENFGTEYKVVRGGAWFLDNPLHFRSSFRRWYKPTFRYYFLGFRCCK